jgi:hypothetical protein
MTELPHDPERRNTDVDWNTFNGKTYRQEYFDVLGPEDAWVINQIVSYLGEAAIQPDQFARGADIGAGPTLAAALAIVPYLQQLEIIEPGGENTAYLESVLMDTDQLAHDWRDALRIITTNKHSLPLHASGPQLLSKRSIVRQLFLQDIEAGRYDLVTSVFCAESATSNRDECGELIAGTVDTLRSGGTFIGAYIEHSPGWPDHSQGKAKVVDMTKFPAANISQAWLEEQFKGTPITVKRCPLKPTIREGYSGVLLAAGTK